MTKEEALNVLIAVACCSSSELYCENCPRNKYTDEIAPSVSDETCAGWSDHEVAEAVKVMREVDKRGVEDVGPYEEGGGGDA